MTTTLLAVAKMQLHFVSPQDSSWLPVSLQAGNKGDSSAVQRREDETAVSAAGRMLLEKESSSSSSSSL